MTNKYKFNLPLMVLEIALQVIESKEEELEQYDLDLQSEVEERFTNLLQAALVVSTSLIYAFDSFVHELIMNYTNLKVDSKRSTNLKNILHFSNIDQSSFFSSREYKTFEKLVIAHNQITQYQEFELDDDGVLQGNDSVSEVLGKDNLWKHFENTIELIRIVAKYLDVSVSLNVRSIMKVSANKVYSIFIK